MGLGSFFLVRQLPNERCSVVLGATSGETWALALHTLLTHYSVIVTQVSHTKNMRLISERNMPPWAAWLKTLPCAHSLLPQDLPPGGVQGHTSIKRVDPLQKESSKQMHTHPVPYLSLGDLAVI